MDTKDMTEPQLQRLQGAASALLAALEALLDVTEAPPAANCTCHIAPPCGDCMDHSLAREVIAEARTAIRAARGED